MKKGTLLPHNTQDDKIHTIFREKYTISLMPAYNHRVSDTGTTEQKTTRKNRYKPYTGL
jgi:hypothetical protein